MRFQQALVFPQRSILFHNYFFQNISDFCPFTMKRRKKINNITCPIQSSEKGQPLNNSKIKSRILIDHCHGSAIELVIG